MKPSISTQSSALLSPTSSSTAAPTPPPPADVFDEPHIRFLLAGDSQQINDARTLIEQHLHPTLTLWLLHRLPCLPPQDLDDIWSDTMLSVINAIRDRRFDSARPLLPWLCNIAERRAIDHIRRRSTLRRASRRLRRRPRTTHYRLADPTSPQEILDLLRDFLPTLPPRQNVVLDIFLEHLPEPPPLAVLLQEVSRRSGQGTTLFAVKRSLQVVRQKLGHLLREHGYLDPTVIAQ